MAQVGEIRSGEALEELSSLKLTPDAQCAKPPAPPAGPRRSATSWRWDREAEEHRSNFVRGCLTPAWKIVLEHHVHYGYGSYVALSSTFCESAPPHCDAAVALFAPLQDLAYLLTDRAVPTTGRRDRSSAAPTEKVAAWVREPLGSVANVPDLERALAHVCVCGEPRENYDHGCALRVYDGLAPPDDAPNLDRDAPSALEMAISGFVDDLRHEAAVDGQPLPWSARIFDAVVSGMVQTLYAAAEPLTRVWAPPNAPVLWLRENHLSVLMHGMLHSHATNEERWAIVLDDPEIELVRPSGGLCQPEPAMPTYVMLPRLTLRLLDSAGVFNAHALLANDHPLRAAGAANPMSAHPNAELRVAIAKRAAQPLLPWIPWATHVGLTWADGRLEAEQWAMRRAETVTAPRRPWRPLGRRPK